MWISVIVTSTPGGAERCGSSCCGSRPRARRRVGKTIPSTVSYSKHKCEEALSVVTLSHPDPRTRHAHRPLLSIGSGGSREHRHRSDSVGNELRRYPGAGCMEQGTSILHVIFERSCYWPVRGRSARAHPRSTTDHRAERRRRKVDRY